MAERSTVLRPLSNPSQEFLSIIEPIREAIKMQASPDEAFSTFVEALDSSWPSAYTWSGDVLETIAIEPKADGRCFERGPHNFECNWGRVLSYEPPARLVFLWQISPRREPVSRPSPIERSRGIVHQRRRCRTG